MMKTYSWKTTVAGALAALGSWAASQPEPWWLWKVGQALQVIGVFLIGAAARDNNVPSEAIPKAAEKAAEIKRDTEILIK